MTLRKTPGVACLTALGLVLATAPAQAGPGDAVADGNAGSLTIGSVTIAPVAACTTEGTLEASVPETTVPEVASFSNSRSVCTIDAGGEVATTTVTGERFRFDALLRYAGPRIRLSSYTANCESTLTGSKASFQLSGLAGVTVPAQIPANHLVTIPGGEEGRPMATVTFNETVAQAFADGSMTVHLMHIRMFPEGGPTSGDAYVGTVHCSPVS